MAALDFSCMLDFSCFDFVIYYFTSGLLARNKFMLAHGTHVLQVVQSEIDLHAGSYDFGIKIATVAVLFYIGLTDLRTFKIHNLSVGVLLLLYVPYAGEARSLNDVFFDVALCLLVVATLIWFYSKGVIGGGDVKLLPIACLWVGTHCAVLFSVILLIFILFHLAAVKVGCVEMRHQRTRWTIPYAPSICGAVAVTIFTGCA